MAAKRVSPPKPKKPSADLARSILKKRATAKVMKKAEEQRRGMAATRKKQQKGRLTAAEARKVTQREKERLQDERYKITQDRFRY